MVFGLFIAYSRVFDHMHHWSDVIIGIGVGTSIAFLVVSVRLLSIGQQGWPTLQLFTS